MVSIVGGYGFIGQNLSEFLTKKKMEIKIIGNNSQNKDLSYTNATLIKANISETEKLANITENTDVIWLATSLIPGNHDKSLNLEFENNIKPIIAYLEYLIKNDIKIGKFIFVSSGGTVYGETDEQKPLREECANKPISAYGLSKLITENYVAYLTKNSNFQSIILRPSNVYGKYQNLNKPQGIIGFALKAAKEKRKLKLINKGRVVRDFIFVDDLAEVIYQVIQKPQFVGKTEIYNVGSGKPFSISQIIDIVSTITNHTFDIQHEESRSFDCKYNVLDISKVTREFDWNPRTSISEGIDEVWKWMTN